MATSSARGVLLGEIEHYLGADDFTRALWSARRLMMTLSLEEPARSQGAELVARLQREVVGGEHAGGMR